MSAAGNICVYEDATRSWALVEADALALLRRLQNACVDCVVTDPPYSIEIAGAAWDRFGDAGLPAAEAFERWTAQWASEVRRVLKPGGHLLAFGAPRTFHRLVAGIEDAGLEVRDQLLWLNGQGIPKSRRMPGGLGTALKPAFEPILLARAPLAGTTPANIARYGTGALNIDSTRLGDGRYWPANVTHTDALEGEWSSRFFYCPKATRAEREAGCEQLPTRSVQLYSGAGRPARVRANTHPTVKPLALMRWLVRLATPPGGVVLDPFAGSGSTGIAAGLEGRRFVGVEREPEFVDVAIARLAHWAKESH